MKYVLRGVAVERLYEALRGLDYYLVEIDGGRSEWRRGGFHLYTYAWSKG